MSYASAAEKPVSEKVTICIAEAVTRFKIFTVYDGDTYVKDVDYFISGISEDGVALPQAESADDCASGSWFFDIVQKKLYLRTTTNDDPKEFKIKATCKFFFADAPYNLPYDLDSGETVEFEARIDSIGKLGQELDDENTGIVLESSSSVSFHNTDGYFDHIIDTLIWENQRITFYSWFPTIPITQNQKLFTGVVESKSFTSERVVFNVKDFIFRLKDKVTLELFSDSDGKLDDTTLGKPKRRVYGQVHQMPCVGTSKTLDGFVLTGTVSVALDSDALTGSGTLFLTELNPGDEIILIVDDEEVKLNVDVINSNTSITLGQESEFDITALAGLVKPTIPFRFDNRIWHIAGHKLREPTIEIESIQSPTRVRSSGISDLFADDSVTVNSDRLTVRRITGDQIVFNQAISPLPSVGDFVVRNPVSKVYYKETELIIERDWFLNNIGEAWIEISPLAEFNVAPQRKLSTFNFTWTNASRSVTTASVIDLKTILKPRDWIRKNSVTENTWYEILAVAEQAITLRVAFVGTTEAITTYYKSVDIIGDDALITVNCLGMEDADGNWIKTPSDAVRHLLLNDASFEDVNETSFAQAKSDCPFILSMVIPESIGDSAPTIKDVITNINESCFGSLFGNQSMSISYAILNSYKPLAMATLQDHDVLNFTTESKQKIVNLVKVNYKPFTDIFTGAASFKTYVQGSDFVDDMIGIKNTEERTIYLFEDDKAVIIAQRIAFFNSLSMCKIKVDGKMNLASLNVNDKMILSFDRMYKRFGGGDRLKIGIVTAISRTGKDVQVDFTDLGNIFNRVPAVAPSDTLSYASGTRDEIARYGYIVDTETLTPDNTSEDELGNNLIG